MAASHGPSSLLLVAFASLMLLCPVPRAGAAEHVVGDVAFGWDSGINYATWAQEHTFAVGDVLVFQYVNTQHNAYEVTESTYRSCDTGGGGNGVRVKYTSGYDRVVLAEAREYWFICDFPGHCLGGMKVAVNVSTGAGGGVGLPPNVPLTPNSSAAPPAGGCRGWMAWGLPLGVLVFMNWAR
ncbi:basic blue protein-like [Phragmites australis]|uniref:basic blue protein-like n=1 Tax=Phragmites australis TaxID=29695 RepID=UPI002D79E237|nr:basic blue protein-like [Phragmites australis]